MPLLDKAKAALWFVWDFLIPQFITEDVALRYVGDDFTATWSEWDFIPGPRIEILAEAARLGGVQFLHTDCSVAAMEVVADILRWVES